MHTLRILGGIGLSDSDGREVDSLLRQPKHAALLAYLSLPRPGTWHRRDSVLGTFWPEHDQPRARAALRSALYTIRGHLPDEMVVSRGDDELSLNAEMVTSDVAAMTDELASGRYKEALALYRGELMPGVYIAESQPFEKWLDHERRRVSGIARKAAAQLSGHLEKQGDFDGAIDAARRAAELDPDDESAARRWIALLDRAGDRAQAFAVYERFRNHMSEAFGVRPSAETVALLDAVRTRRAVGLNASAVAPVPAPDTPGPGPTPSPVDISHASGKAETPTLAAPSRVRGQLLWIAVPVIVVMLGWMAIRPQRNATGMNATAARSLIILPMENQTGDEKLEYVAAGIAEGVARRLEGIGGIRIRSGARGAWSNSARRDVRGIGREFGSTILLRSSLLKAGDSLEARASVVDASTLEERTVAAVRFSTAGIRDAESRLAAAVSGEVFRVPIPTSPRNSGRPIDPESYRLALEGWHQLFVRRPDAGGDFQRQVAAALFTRAIDIDPQNARAWSGMSSVWAARVVTDEVSYDDGYPRAVAASHRALAIDSLEGTALANLAIMRAFEYESLAAGTELIRKAEAAEPSNPEVFLIKSLIFRSAHLYDQARDAIRVARQLDPLSPYYNYNEPHIEFCAGRPEAALKLYRAQTEIDPSDALAGAGVTRSLAMLGRYDEAIESWRREAIVARDTVLAGTLSNVKGREGYWELRHALGRLRRDALDRRQGRVSPLSRARASFAAGDASRGFAELEIARAAGTPALYRLTCMAEIDEFRQTPQFSAALGRIGALRVR